MTKKSVRVRGGMGVLDKIDWPYVASVEDQYSVYQLIYFVLSERSTNKTLDLNNFVGMDSTS